MPYADPAAKRRHDTEYRAARRAELAAKQRDYYRRNRKACDAQNRQWYAANPQVTRLVRAANSMNRRAVKWGCPGKLNTAVLRAIVGPCVYCGGTQETWDHVIPLWRGGANDSSNLVPCCHACNRHKGR
jgi:5-methylcytosine-specific restriction endonuclease McrA